MNENELKNDIDMRKGDGYEEFEQEIINHFNSLVNKNTPLFTTNAESLWGLYLNNLPVEGRQHYNCNCCRHFIEQYGNLATVNENGLLESILWTQDVPTFFKESVKELRKTVNNSRITGVFISDTKTLGTPKTGIWSHIHVILPNEMVNKSRINTASQIMAEKLEDYRMLSRGLIEYSIETVQQALNLLKSEALYRSDKCLGVAEWLYKLHENRNNTKSGRVKENITWLAVGKAPTGFCHIKSSMIGTLLDDIALGLSFEIVSRKFAEKMNPSNYMRSQVAPTEGNIQQAEKIVEKLGIADSLRRRYATFEEIPQFIWKNNYSAKKEVKTNGVFGNIIPKDKKVSTINNECVPSTVMTWDKFLRTVLPTVENIEVKVDNTNRLMALVTASDETSENILQWDNPFSWYYHGGIDGEIKRRVESAGGRYENNEIRCSLIWEGYTDLDLHCVTPRGEHIYFGDKTDRYNGWLDVDANGGRPTTESPVENIRWSNNAPTGNYEFYVHNYNERVNRYRGTSFKVELEINGKVYHYCGESLTNNNRITVFEFDYIRGQQPEIRNSSSYSSSNSWNIDTNDFIKVNGITNSPNLWDEKSINHSGNHIFFLLDGCKDLSEGKGRGFFTETLKSELHEVRKTLEAYCSNSKIIGIENSDANGVGYSKDNAWDLTLKVTSNNSTRIIKIDRWD